MVGVFFDRCPISLATVAGAGDRFKVFLRLPLDLTQRELLMGWCFAFRDWRQPPHLLFIVLCVLKGGQGGAGQCQTRETRHQTARPVRMASGIFWVSSNDQDTSYKQTQNPKIQTQNEKRWDCLPGNWRPSPEGRQFPSATSLMLDGINVNCGLYRHSSML